jgi:hypothetical protein
VHPQEQNNSFPIPNWYSRAPEKRQEGDLLHIAILTSLFLLAIVIVIGIVGAGLWRRRQRALEHQKRVAAIVSEDIFWGKESHRDGLCFFLRDVLVEEGLVPGKKERKEGRRNIKEERKEKLRKEERISRKELRKEERKKGRMEGRKERYYERRKGYQGRS